LNLTEGASPLRDFGSTCLSLLLLTCFAGGLASAGEPLAFEVAYTDAVRPGPISARVYVMLAPPLGFSEPRTGPDWFKPQPFFAVDAKDWQPGRPITIDAKAAGFPSTLDKVEAGSYRAQAVVRLNPDAPALDGEGNAYSPTQTIKLDPSVGGVVKFTVDKVEPPISIPESPRIKLVELPSPILSAFHKRPIRHRAAVHLPEGDRSIKLPTLYIIPGFGGDPNLIKLVARDRRFAFGVDLIRVVLDPGCGTGHHVFADSATNGPRGEALIKEFIPYLEKTFNAIPEPGARLLNGHSSGGWSSLWLQVTYPDFFGGTWSTSPDPVDFRDFQRVDLYARGVNFYRQADGSPRPVARLNDKAAVFVEPFVRMEEVIGNGGQLSSFEAVFSPLDSAGRPRKLWDRTTGLVDPETAKAWEKYDIRLVLERNWPTLAPKLKGKIHVITGDKDTFYLDGATILLKESLAKLGSDAVVTLASGKDHFNLISRPLAQQLDREMREAVKLYLPKPAKAVP